MGVIILSEREMSVEMDDVKMKDGDVGDTNGDVADKSPSDNPNTGEESDTDGDISDTDKAVADENPGDDMNSGETGDTDGDVAEEPSAKDDKQGKAKSKTRKGRTNTKKN